MIEHAHRLFTMRKGRSPRMVDLHAIYILASPIDFQKSIIEWPTTEETKEYLNSAVCIFQMTCLYIYIW